MADLTSLTSAISSFGNAWGEIDERRKKAIEKEKADKLAEEDQAYTRQKREREDSEYAANTDLRDLNRQNALKQARLAEMELIGKEDSLGKKTTLMGVLQDPAAKKEALQRARYDHAVHTSGYTGSFDDFIAQEAREEKGNKDQDLLNTEKVSQYRIKTKQDSADLLGKQLSNKKAMRELDAPMDPSDAAYPRVNNSGKVAPYGTFWLDKSGNKETFANDYKEAVAITTARNKVLSTYDRMRKIMDKGGESIFIPSHPARAQLEQAYYDLLMQKKEKGIYNLGVLNGKDLPVLQKIDADPGAAKSIVREVIGSFLKDDKKGISVIYDMIGANEKAIDTAVKQGLRARRLAMVPEEDEFDARVSGKPSSLSTSAPPVRKTVDDYLKAAREGMSTVGGSPKAVPEGRW